MKFSIIGMHAMKIIHILEAPEMIYSTVTIRRKLVFPGEIKSLKIIK